MLTLAQIQKLSKRSYRQLLRDIEGGRLYAKKDESGNYAVKPFASDVFLDTFADILEGYFILISDASGNRYTPHLLRYCYQRASDAWWEKAKSTARNTPRNIDVNFSVSELILWLIENPYDPEAPDRIEAWLRPLVKGVYPLILKDMESLRRLSVDSDESGS